MLSNTLPDVYDDHFQSSSSLNLLTKIKAKFHVEPHWKGGNKVYINGPGHMTKMAAMSIYDKKNFRKFLFQNRKSYDFKIWHAASGTQALQSLYK